MNKVQRYKTPNKNNNPNNLPSLYGNGNNGNIGNDLLQKIFTTQPSKYALRKGKTHCQSIENTAIFVDRCGNKMIFKQQQTIMNTDKDGPAIYFHNSGKQFKKNKK